MESGVFIPLSTLLFVSRKFQGHQFPLDNFTLLDYYWPMITTVTGKNQITIPVRIVRALDIQPGTRLDWSVDDQGALVVEILPHRGVLARRAAGMAKEWVDAKSNPIDDLITERVRDDAENELT